VDDGDLESDPVDIDRASMMEMMAEWRDLVRQLTCDRMCWVCPPARVISCSKFNCEPGLREKVRNRERTGGD